MPFRSLMRFGRDSFLRSPANILFAQVSQVVYVRAEGPKALSSGQWIQAARPEGAEAFSSGQWTQAARPEGAEALSPGQRTQAARPEGAEALSPGQRTQAARPEGAEALSPGQRPGLFGAVTCRPYRAHCCLPLYPGRCPGLRASAPSGRVGQKQGVWGKNLRTFSCLCVPPRVPFFSLRAYHFLRGLNLVNDCSKCHEIRNICTL